MSIQGKVTGEREVVAALQAAGASVRSAVEKEMLRLAIKLTSLVKQKLSGQVLKVRTGRLRRSITHRMESSGQRITAIVGTNVEYAKTHELGLTLPPRIVEAKRGKALKFTVGGKVMFRKRVSIPAVKMPQRSFLKASLDQMRPEIVSALTKAAERGLRGKR